MKLNIRLKFLIKYRIYFYFEYSHDCITEYDGYQYEYEYRIHFQFEFHFQ